MMEKNKWHFPEILSESVEFYRETPVNNASAEHPSQPLCVFHFSAVVGLVLFLACMTWGVEG